MNINIVCVGNLKEKFWLEAEGEYLKRLQRFCKLSIKEVAEANKYSDIDKILSDEGRHIIESRSGHCILLDINGKEVSSEELAKKIESLMQQTSTITFIIGGSYGVSDEVKNSVDEKVSFGKITLPHNLARIVLLEQIYRSFMILSNSKYHK